MINIINFTSKDNPQWPPQAEPPGPEGTARVEDRPGRRRGWGRIWTALAAAVADCLSGYSRRWGDRWYMANDEEACWRGWQTTRTHGGLGRRYRDPAFDSLAECSRCQGAGVRAEARCLPCQGTGRISLSEVS